MPRAGMTLVEVLIVIVILAMLMAIILPAVQAAREAARSAQCANNLKQLGGGMIVHQEMHGFLPSGGWGNRWTGDPDRGTGKDQPGGWTYCLLPYTDQSAIHKLGSDGMPAVVSAGQAEGAAKRDETPLAIFTCPSRRAPGPYRRTSTGNGAIGSHVGSYFNGYIPAMGGVVDYAANGGTDPVWTVGPDNEALDPNFAWKPLEDTTRGNTGISFQRSRISSDEISDGSSNTYMLGEKYLNPVQYFDGTNAADDSGMYEGCGHDTYRWTRPSVGAADETPKQDQRGDASTHSFGSAHAAGCRFVMCDGRVRTITYDTAPGVHAQLANRRDGQVFKDPGR